MEGLDQLHCEPQQNNLSGYGHNGQSFAAICKKLIMILILILIWQWYAIYYNLEVLSTICGTINILLSIF